MSLMYLGQLSLMYLGQHGTVAECISRQSLGELAANVVQTVLT